MLRTFGECLNTSINIKFSEFFYSIPQEIVDLIPGYRFANRLVAMPAAYYDALQQGGKFDFDRFHKEVMYGSRYESVTLSDIISSVLWAMFEVLFRLCVELVS